MKYPRPQSTTERRAHQDRRARTRSGRREHDPSPKHCPSCGGTDPVALGVTHGVFGVSMWYLSAHVGVAALIADAISKRTESPPA